MTKPQLYVKKRIPVEARQFYMDSEKGEELRSAWDRLVGFTGGLVKHTTPEDDGDWAQYYVFDYLHNTWVEFKLGDWIIRGIKGEYYPVEEAVFEETYERHGVR